MRYMTPEEAMCKCGCGKSTDINFLEQIDKARAIADVPFVVNSGARCYDQNTAVGGSLTSSHMKGIAIDIKCTNSICRYKILKGLIAAGFNRIGIAKTFIHVDSDPNKASNVIWTYK